MDQDRTIIGEEDHRGDAEESSTKTSTNDCYPCSTENMNVAAHSLRKATTNHRPSLIKQENQGHYQNCEQCREGQKKLTAIKFCNDCMRFLCQECSNVHINDDTTKDHRQMDLTDQEYEEIQSDECRRYGTGRESQEREAFTGDNDKQRTDCPGKPKQERVQVDAVTVSWAPIEKFHEAVYYQVCYKMSGNDSQWVNCPDRFEDSCAIVYNLKSNTEFIFRVRAITTHGKGPYSEESQTIKTLESAAAKWKTMSMPLSGRSFLPTIYALPVVNEPDTRNEIAKTKRCKLGDDTFGSFMSKTIMLVGATGTGKSTFVDGLINYIMGVKWEDDFRLTIIDKEQVSAEKRGNEAFSQTDWITCYTVNPKPGSRFAYQLNIIDTPGFGDTSGLERDRNIVEQVRQLFTEREPKGSKFIDAVCFLLKSPDARLTPAQKYIFDSIMSLFGKDIEENICSIITFADSEDAPVLAAMKESKLPFGKTFHFNNAGLFARNTNPGPANISQIFWKESMKSFRTFFEYLETAETKSLQLTEEVLEERYNLEMFASVLMKQISESLRKNDSLLQEIKIIEEHQSAMKNNENFEYEIEEMKIKTIPKTSKHVTNCEKCQKTCHDNCGLDKDDKKHKCRVMSKAGDCLMCGCGWSVHKNAHFQYMRTHEKVKKTYEDMKKKYTFASNEIVEKRDLVDRLKQEIDEMHDTIENEMVLVSECRSRLDEIALRPDPLTDKEFIEILIRNEKNDRKRGFEERIEFLENFKKNTMVTVEYASWKESARTAVKDFWRKGQNAIRFAMKKRQSHTTSAS